MQLTATRPVRASANPLERALGLRRVSRPQQAGMILVGTAFICAAVLLAWVIIWLSWSAGATLDGWWVAQRPREAGPVFPPQAEDLRRVRGLKEALPEGLGLPVADLPSELRAALKRDPGRPAVIYLSAAGISDGFDAFFLPNEGAIPLQSARAADPITVDRLLDVFGEYPDRDALLILDAGQIGTDRDLGVYGNPFLARLKAKFEEKKLKRLAILTSCAPGQSSWWSENSARSAFGHFVSLGLSGQAKGVGGGGLTLRGLHKYVAYCVERWADQNRKAIQTPELLAISPDLNFDLRATPPPKDLAKGKEADEKARAEFEDRLHQAWEAHEALARLRPYRHDPLRWLSYQERLLRAERFARVGARADAEAALNDAGSLRARLQSAAGGLAVESPWSLALASRGQPDDSRARDHDSRAAFALKDIVPEVEGVAAGDPASTPPPPEPEPEPAAKAQPRTDPAAKGESKPDAAKEPARPASNRRPGSDGSSRDAAIKPKPGASLATLLDPRDRRLPALVEDQLLVWADVFEKKFGTKAKVDFEGGPRPDARGAAWRSAGSPSRSPRGPATARRRPPMTGRSAGPGRSSTPETPTAASHRTPSSPPPTPRITSGPRTSSRRPRSSMPAPAMRPPTSAAPPTWPSSSLPSFPITAGGCPAAATAWPSTSSSTPCWPTRPRSAGCWPPRRKTRSPPPSSP